MDAQKDFAEKFNNANQLHQQGMEHMENEDYEQALDCYKKSMAIRKELDDPFGLASICGQVGVVLMKKGDLEAALHHLLEAFRLFMNLGSPDIRLVVAHIERIGRFVGEEPFRDMLEKLGVDADQLAAVMVEVSGVAPPGKDDLSDRLKSHVALAAQCRETEGAGRRELVERLETIHRDIPDDQTEFKAYSSFLLAYANQEETREMKGALPEKFLDHFESVVGDISQASIIGRLDEYTALATMARRNSAKRKEVLDTLKSLAVESGSTLPPDVKDYIEFLIAFASDTTPDGGENDLPTNLKQLFEAVQQEMEKKDDRRGG
ncbi:MAG: tetratricopeptide repeat protein [Proteobacteria bacterium]|nr:tetratricopeptide repeat protein [Pseudomonadota bacterium]